MLFCHNKFIVLLYLLVMSEWNDRFICKWVIAFHWFLDFLCFSQSGSSKQHDMKLKIVCMEKYVINKSHVNTRFIYGRFYTYSNVGRKVYVWLHIYTYKICWCDIKTIIGSMFTKLLNSFKLYRIELPMNTPLRSVP